MIDRLILKKEDYVDTTYGETLTDYQSKSDDKWLLTNDFVQKAKLKALSSKLHTMYMKLFDEDQMDEFTSLGFGEYDKVLIEGMSKLKVKCDNIQDVKQGKNPWCFFTINFKPDVSVEAITTVMADFVKKSTHLNTSRYMYVLEQRGTLGEEFSGFHVHILFEKGEIAPSKLQRTFKTKFFDKYVGNPSCLDYKFIAESEGRIKYMLGFKKDKEKVGKCDNDKLFREHHKVETYYQQGLEKEIEIIISPII